MTQPPVDSSAASSAEPTTKKRGGLSTMLLADLKSMASGLGISGARSMKKAQLVEAIRASQSGGQSGGHSVESSVESAVESGRSADQPGRSARVEAPAALPIEVPTEGRTEVAGEGPSEAPAPAQGTTNRAETGEGAEPKSGANRRRDRSARGRGKAAQGGEQERSSEQTEAEPADQPRQQQRKKQQDKQQRNQSNQNQSNQNQSNQNQSSQNQDRSQDKNQANQNQANQNQDKNQTDSDDDLETDEDGTTRRNRRRRGRERTTTRAGRNEPDTTIREDDVLVPAAGILDVLDNYAFVRTSGYLPAAEDVYVSLSMVRKFGLRRGDAIVGQVRQPREGERKEKFNPMVRIDSVNGIDPEGTVGRAEFDKLTPVHPAERLRLETGSANLIGRVIDIVAPIGKGQRGLIVSPAKSGKTVLLQSIATSITTNNPECHLMVVLVDERPEEVTDFQRSVKGEVIASTFDHPAGDHAAVAELSIERAKRLVELGHDVVVLLDGLTRLGRAYNQGAAAGGRSGGVDSAALYPAKKFFGAARNVENGGSLTIIATAQVESGSNVDELIFEEFTGTGNHEIRLRRELAERRVLPAIDPLASATRREELLIPEEELAIVWKLRRVLGAQSDRSASEFLIEQLHHTATNIELLTRVQQMAEK